MVEHVEFKDLKRHCGEHRKKHHSCLGCQHQRICDEISILIGIYPNKLKEDKESI